MDQTTEIVNRVLPILLLIGLGAWIRWRQFLPEHTIDDLRKMVTNFALPAVLFLSFLNTDLQTKYIAIFITMIVLLAVMLASSRAAQRRWSIPHLYFPFLMTGFEYGMVGIALYGSAYGLDRLGPLAVMDLGHELFIWFVFLAFMLSIRDGAQRPVQLARTFFSSPVVIGILTGIALNLLGAQSFLYGRPVIGAGMRMLEYLSDLLIPLILIIVGYGIKLDRAGLRDAATVIAVRLAILIPLALILSRLLIRDLLDLGAPFEAALFTMLILPPPFIIPLYMRTDLPDERRYVNNVLTLYTLASVVVFSIYAVVGPQF
jgi:predicted permease